MGSVSVSSCICCMFVSWVHPATVLNAAFANAGRGCKKRLYERVSKRHNLQLMELSHRSQTAVQIGSKLPAPR